MLNELQFVQLQCDLAKEELEQLDIKHKKGHISLVSIEVHRARRKEIEIRKQIFENRLAELLYGEGSK